MVKPASDPPLNQEVKKANLWDANQPIAQPKSNIWDEPKTTLTGASTIPTLGQQQPAKPSASLWDEKPLVEFTGPGLNGAAGSQFGGGPSSISLLKQPTNFQSKAQEPS